MAVDRKKLILNAATKSFSTFGYKATTMDQVAKLANVGKGTIYTFFKNKEDLLQDIMKSLIEEMKRSAEATFDEDKSFYENVHRAIYKMLEFRRKHKLALKLYEEGKLGTPEVIDALERMENAIVNYISQILERAIKKGEINPCNPKLTAFIILKMYVALIFDWEKTNPPLSKDEILQLFELYIFKGIAPEGK